MVWLLSDNTLIVRDWCFLVLSVLLQNHTKAIICSCRVRVDFNCVHEVLLSTLTLVLTGKQGGQVHASAKIVTFERKALLEKLHTFLVLLSLLETDSSVVVRRRLCFTLLSGISLLSLNALFKCATCSLPVFKLEVHLSLKK